MRNRTAGTQRGYALAVALLAVIGAVVIAGCGGGGSSSSSPESSEESGATTASNSGGGGTISAAEISGLGKVLVDAEGMTVYLFTPDKGSTSVCYGGCESAWPPVTAEGKPTAGEGAMSSALGTTKRKDGSLQVTYEGHPLYTFVGDKGSGEANGQESEGTWFVMDEAGSEVKGRATAAGGEAEAESEPAGEEGESSGGYGY